METANPTEPLSDIWHVSLKWHTRSSRQTTTTEIKRIRKHTSRVWGMQTKALLLLFWNKILTLLTMLWPCFFIHRVSFVSGPSATLRRHEEHQTFPSTNRMSKQADLQSSWIFNYKHTDIQESDWNIHITHLHSALMHAAHVSHTLVQKACII